MDWSKEDIAKFNFINSLIISKDSTYERELDAMGCKGALLMAMLKEGDISEDVFKQWTKQILLATYDKVQSKVV